MGIYTGCGWYGDKDSRRKYFFLSPSGVFNMHPTFPVPTTSMLSIIKKSNLVCWALMGFTFAPIICPNFSIASMISFRVTGVKEICEFSTAKYSIAFITSLNAASISLGHFSVSLRSPPTSITGMGKISFFIWLRIPLHGSSSLWQSSTQMCLWTMTRSDSLHFLLISSRKLLSGAMKKLGLIICGFTDRNSETLPKQSCSSTSKMSIFCLVYYCAKQDHNTSDKTGAQDNYLSLNK